MSATKQYVFEFMGGFSVAPPVYPTLSAHFAGAGAIGDLPDLSLRSLRTLTDANLFKDATVATAVQTEHYMAIEFVKWMMACNEACLQRAMYERDDFTKSLVAASNVAIGDLAECMEPTAVIMARYSARVLKLIATRNEKLAKGEKDLEEKRASHKPQATKTSANTVEKGKKDNFGKLLALGTPHKPNNKENRDPGKGLTGRSSGVLGSPSAPSPQILFMSPLTANSFTPVVAVNSCQTYPGHTPRVQGRKRSASDLENKDEASREAKKPRVAGGRPVRQAALKARSKLVNI